MILLQSGFPNAPKIHLNKFVIKIIRLPVAKSIYESCEMHGRMIEARIEHSAVLGNEIHVVKDEAVYIGSHVSNHRKTNVVKLS